MVLVSTKIQVVDNSGVLFVRCIRLLRGSRNNSAGLGKYIIGTVQKVSSNKLVKKNKQKKSMVRGDICKCLIVCNSNNIFYENTFFLRSDYNAVILVGDNFLPTASRIIGPVSLKFRVLKQLKLLTIADIVF